MSRVGKKPIPVPDKTKLNYNDRLLTVEGSKGSLSRTIHPAVDLKINDGIIQIIAVDEDRTTRALQGLTRSCGRRSDHPCIARIDPITGGQHDHGCDTRV